MHATQADTEENLLRIKPGTWDHSQTLVIKTLLLLLLFIQCHFSQATSVPSTSHQQSAQTRGRHLPEQLRYWSRHRITQLRAWGSSPNSGSRLRSCTPGEAAGVAPVRGFPPPPRRSRWGSWFPAQVLAHLWSEPSHSSFSCSFSQINSGWGGDRSIATSWSCSGLFHWTSYLNGN